MNINDLNRLELEILACAKKYKYNITQEELLDISETVQYPFSVFDKHCLVVQNIKSEIETVFKTVQQFMFKLTMCEKNGMVYTHATINNKPVSTATIVDTSTYNSILETVQDIFGNVIFLHKKDRPKNNYEDLY